MSVRDAATVFEAHLPPAGNSDFNAVNSHAGFPLIDEQKTTVKNESDWKPGKIGRIDSIGIRGDEL